MIDVLVNFVQKEIKAMLDRETLDPKEREVKLEPRGINMKLELREIELMLDEQMCFIKYHVSEDRSSIVEFSWWCEPLRCVSAYHEAAGHLDAKFGNGEG